jgi:hypothetical protein
MVEQHGCCGARRRLTPSRMDGIASIVLVVWTILFFCDNVAELPFVK